MKRLLDTYPMLSNAAIYGGLYTLAELSQQTMKSNLTTTHSHQTLDMSSVKRYAVMGTIVFPPILTKWYHWLETVFPCTSPKVVMKKLVLDQFLLTPWCVAIFFVGMAALEGKRGEALLSELKQKGITTFILDCCYWLPVQYLNFKFVPAWLRVTYIGVTTFIWLNVLCYIKSLPTTNSKEMVLYSDRETVKE